ncbi:MAG: rhomboid family intramembrane serine protease [Actinomycetota bacterium]|nr:rhomboid family intramembrane serine protease [Actinomycetota bacterium]
MTGVRGLVLHLWRTYPGTIGLAVVVVAVSLVGLFSPAVVSTFDREPTLILHGQWWRILTQLLVQREGWVQFVVNVAGLVILGTAVERRTGRAALLLSFFAAGVGAAVLLVFLQPRLVDAGTSNAVAGILGLLAVFWSRGDGQSPLVPYLYSVFFVSYLAAIDIAPLGITIAIACVLTGVLASIRLMSRSRVSAVLLVVTVTTAAAVLCLQHDGHGFGLAIGLAIGTGVTVHARYRRAVATVTT